MSELVLDILRIGGAGVLLVAAVFLLAFAGRALLRSIEGGERG